MHLIYMYSHTQNIDDPLIKFQQSKFKMNILYRVNSQLLPPARNCNFRQNPP